MPNIIIYIPKCKAVFPFIANQTLAAATLCDITMLPVLIVLIFFKHNLDVKFKSQAMIVMEISDSFSNNPKDSFRHYLNQYFSHTHNKTDIVFYMYIYKSANLQGDETKNKTTRPLS